MKIIKIILLSWIFSSLVAGLSAQENSSSAQLESRGEDGLRIMLYNVENLFDTFDDPAINDDEFTPKGDKNWTYYRYRDKLNKIAKTIIAVGRWEPPDVVGLCEVENFQVLLDLTTETPLKNFGYQIVHENSKDSRGIDNALVYLPDKLNKIEHRAINVNLDKGNSTRDILYASFSFQDKDTIHFYVNHWPSRYGGKSFSEDKRMAAANSLKLSIDSLHNLNPKNKVFIMGDFNDEPDDKSLIEVLNVKSNTDLIDNNLIYNLSYPDYKAGKGTLVFKEIDHTWFLFDQIIVSGSLIAGRGLQIKRMKSSIFSTNWLLKDGRPYRTYQGPIYRKGFSDHLPIFIDLYYKK